MDHRQRPSVRSLHASCLAALAALAIAGCTDEQPAPPPPDLSMPGCANNTDCAKSPGGHVCNTDTGLCVVCVASADCPTGQHCDNQVACVECLLPADCPMGQRCVAKACVVGCDPKSPCPQGQVCDFNASACYQCLSDSDCTDGTTPRCDLLRHKCVGCVKDDDCGAGQV